MKIYEMVLMAAVAGTLMLTGCSKKSSVDTAPLQKSFQSADPAAQSAVDKVVSSVKSEDYAGALTQLQQLAKNATLTPEQKQAITDMVAQVQKVIADVAGKAAGEAGKAAGDLQKAMPK
jgi:hypothetical protein